ncbi:MAG: hypothetical protein WKF96_20265, partial [Solirubrobacteraceae bacterium]
AAATRTARRKRARQATVPMPAVTSIASHPTRRRGRSRGGGREHRGRERAVPARHDDEAAREPRSGWPRRWRTFTAGFAPRDITYRTIDFRTNEFRGLEGGEPATGPRIPR